MNSFEEQLQALEGRRWLSFQYVLGELPELQIEAFESAMLEDPSLCETVVDASRLVSGIVVSHDNMPVAMAEARCILQERQSRPVWGRVSLLCVSVLGLVVALINLYPSEIATVVSSEDAETADALVSMLPDGSVSDPDIMFDEVAAEEGSIADLVAPEWLLTAVDLELNEAGEALPDESHVY